MTEIQGNITTASRLKDWIATVCCIAMVAGLLFSRALLSVTMIVLFLNALWPQQLSHTWRDFKKDRFGTGCLLFFLAYALSGFWSTDTPNWAAMLQIKMPFLFLPFAMLQAPLDQAKLRNIIVCGILLLLSAGMVYGPLMLIYDPALRLQPHMPSPVEGDYIRFTMALVFGIQLAAWYIRYRKEYALSGSKVRLLLLWILLASVYIHVQAAKSGLICFYVLLGIFLLSQFTGKKKWLALAGLPALLTLGALCVLWVPSLRRQMDGMLKERTVWQQQDVSQFGSTASLVPRLLSYRIAGRLIVEHPVIGLGAGDMKATIDQVYINEYPKIPEYARLLPHNQFLCTTLAIGIPLSLLMCFMVVAPLRRTGRTMFVVATFCLMLVGLMIEPMLETQNGIFVYLFFTLLWMRMPDPAKKPLPVSS